MPSGRIQSFATSDLIALTAAGLTNKEIGRRLGVTSEAIWHACKRHGLPTRRVSPGPRPRYDAAALSALVAEGLTDWQIAARLGGSTQSVWHARKQAGIPGWPRGRRKKAV